MATQTAEISADKKGLMEAIEFLPERAILQVKGYIERIREEELERISQDLTLEEIDAEIAELEAKYGTTPNAETIAAMEEAEAGGGEVTTIEEIMAELNAKD